MNKSDSNALAFLSFISALVCVLGAVFTFRAVQNHKKTPEGVADIFLNHFRSNKISRVTNLISGDVAPRNCISLTGFLWDRPQLTEYDYLKTLLGEKTLKHVSGLLTSRTLSRLEWDLIGADSPEDSPKIDVEWGWMGVINYGIVTPKQKAALIQVIAADMAQQRDLQQAAGPDNAGVQNNRSANAAEEGVGTEIAATTLRPQTTLIPLSSNSLSSDSSGLSSPEQV